MSKYLLTAVIGVISCVLTNLISEKIKFMNWNGLLPWLVASVAVFVTYVFVTGYELKKQIKELKNELNNKVDKNKPLDKGHSTSLGM